MPRVDTDFENVDSPVDAGTYLFEISGSQIKNTKTDGSTMIAWELTIADEGPFLGRKLYFNSNLADKKGPEEQRKANFYLREFLKAVGAAWDPAGFDTEQAMHCQGVAEVVIEEYEGRPISRVKKVMPTPERQAAMEAEKAAAGQTQS